MRGAAQLGLAIAIAAALPAAAHADDSASGNGASPPQAVVWCYEATREVVSRVLLGECHGKIITDSEAAAIREKRESQIKRALQRRAAGSTEGLHLASLGTGFYIDDSGHLLTNYHVVDDCTVVTVNPGTTDVEISADVVAVDRALDIALVKADTNTGATAEFPAVGTVLAGPSVAIVGYPTQGLPPLDPLATPGFLIENAATIGGVDHIVMRADLRHGNSGGPIFDPQGRVIGMVNAKLDSPAYYRATGLNVTDIGFGIPGRTLIDFLTRNDASHEESRGGEAFTLAEILQRARGFVVRAECWK